MNDDGLNKSVLGQEKSKAGNLSARKNSESIKDVKNYAQKKGVIVTEKGNLDELNMDNVPAIINIRKFADKKLDELTQRYNDPEGRRLIDKEELAAVFQDVYYRYTQRAMVAPSLQAVFSERISKLGAKYSYHYSRAQTELTEFNRAKTSYQNAVTQMRLAYRSLNESELEYPLDDAIMGYDPIIEPFDIISNISEVLGTDNA
jgi:hypothetical protein